MRRMLLVPLLAAIGGPPASAAAPACPVPDELQLHGVALPASVAALASGKPIRIVALGAGSTVGAAAGDPADAYPARLQARLAAALPKARIEVVNAGAPREDAGLMLARLDKTVLDRHPTLVVWEAGTNDATRGREVDDFAADLDEGVMRLHAAGVDVILMDMQYAPSTASIIDFDPYLEALHRVADLAQVPVFRRYDIMHGWSDDGVFSYDETSPEDRRAVARRVYDCLAEGLASGIEEALK